MKRIWIIAVTLALAGCAPEKPGYTVRLQRDFKPGMKYNVTVKGQESISGDSSPGGTTNASTTATNALHYNVDLDIEIVAVDKTRRPTAIKATVNSFTTARGENSKSVYKNGTLISGQSSNGDKTFEIEGTAINSEIAQRILSESTPLAGGKYTDDDIYGTNEKKLPGAAWEINREALIELMKLQGLDVKAGDITGSAALTEIQSRGNTSCMKITVKESLQAAPINAGAEMKMSRMFFELEATSVAPVDITLLPVDEIQTSTVTFTGILPAKANPQATATVEIVKTTTEKHYRPIP